MRRRTRRSLEETFGFYPLPAYLDGRPRKGAWGGRDHRHARPTKWPPRSRVIVRRERPHSGARLRFTDGHRFTAFITDAEGGQLVDLEVHHRSHARVEDRIRCGKNTGLPNLPCRGCTEDKVWLALALTAADLLTRTQALCFTGELVPVTFRYRIRAIAAKLIRTARIDTMHLDQDWPWAQHLANAFTRRHAVPWPA